MELYNEYGIELAEKYVSNKTPIHFIMQIDCPLIDYGNLDFLNLETAKQSGMLLVNSYRDCGTLVCNKGDIFLIDVRPTNSNIFLDCLYYISWKLNCAGINSTIDHNDLVVNNYKLGSSMQIHRANGMVYTGVFFAMSVNLYLIKQICTKPMLKTPKGLNNFGITQEFIINALEEFEKKNY